MRTVRVIKHKGTERGGRVGVFVRFVKGLPTAIQSLSVCADECMEDIVTRVIRERQREREEADYLDPHRQLPFTKNTPSLTH